jgi:hypothetical protein
MIAAIYARLNAKAVDRRYSARPIASPPCKKPQIMPSLL